jgi:broad specificity phosphatase PhoE
VIASDLPRTVASAVRLAPERDIVRTPLLREAPMETPDRPLPAFGGMRLPFRAWGMVWGSRWLVAYLRNQPPPGSGPRSSRGRSKQRLARRAGDARRGRVVVVTHATFRVVLARRSRGAAGADHGEVVP